MSIQNKTPSNEQLFARFNHYFDHIYVLTLERCKERQENIKRVLAGLDYRFFLGTDKKQLNLARLVEQGIYDDTLHKTTKRTKRSMNLGEVACALSHKRIYRDVLEKGYRRVLIMEDDVLPVQAQISRFNELLEQLPEDWELLMLGYYGEKRPAIGYKLQRDYYRVLRKYHIAGWHKINWFDKLLMAEYSKDIYAIGKVLGTHAYAINASAAQKFIDFQTPIKLQADRIFNYYQGEHSLKAFAPKKVLFTLSELSRFSNIQN